MPMGLRNKVQKEEREEEGAAGGQVKLDNHDTNECRSVIKKWTELPRAQKEEHSGRSQTEWQAGSYLPRPSFCTYCCRLLTWIQEAASVALHLLFFFMSPRNCVWIPEIIVCHYLEVEAQDRYSRLSVASLVPYDDNDEAAVPQSW